MYTMNQLTIIGFTGNDAEAHYTQNGTLVVTISVATKESWKDADGNWQSRTDWHRIVSFGKQAEFTRTLTKGSYVMVQCARASMSAMARSTASSKFALTRSASSIAPNAALKPKASLTPAMPDEIRVRSFAGRTRSSRLLALGLAGSTSSVA
jgi:single-stranded DNA-binding protein